MIGNRVLKLTEKANYFTSYIQAVKLRISNKGGNHHSITPNNVKYKLTEGKRVGRKLTEVERPLAEAIMAAWGLWCWATAINLRPKSRLLERNLDLAATEWKRERSEKFLEEDKKRGS